MWLTAGNAVMTGRDIQGIILKNVINIGGIVFESAAPSAFMWILMARVEAVSTCWQEIFSTVMGIRTSYTSKLYLEFFKFYPDTNTQIKTKLKLTQFSQAKKGKILVS